MKSKVGVILAIIGIICTLFGLMLVVGTHFSGPAYAYYATQLEQGYIIALLGLLLVGVGIGLK